IAVFYIEAAGTLQLNTTGTARLGVAAHSFMLDVLGKVEILKVLKFDTRLHVEVKDNEWSFLASTDVDFFGIITLSGSVALDSKGNFDVSLKGAMLLGSEFFGLKGEFHFRVRSEVIADAIGNPYFIFELSGGASVQVKVFGITLVGVGLDFSFHAEGNGSVPIVLSVKVKIDLGLFSIEKTADFKIGVLELPKPVFLAGKAGSGLTDQSWDPNTGGALHLNVGSRGQFRNIATDDNAEPFIIEQLGASQGKALIKVTAFGRSNIFDNVTNIVADFGAGNDSIRMLSGATIPVEIHGGPGDGHLRRLRPDGIQRQRAEPDHHVPEPGHRRRRPHRADVRGQQHHHRGWRPDGRPGRHLAALRARRGRPHRGDAACHRRRSA